MNFITNILRPAFRLIQPGLKRRGFWLTVWLVVQSLLDVASVGSLAPMALLIIHPNSAEQNSFFSKLYSAGNFEATTTFALTWVVGIAVFFVLKHVISLRITRAKSSYVFDVSSSLSRRMMNHFMGLPFSYYYELKSSVEFVKIAHLPNSFGTNILQALLTLLTESFVFLLLVGSLVWVDWHSLAYLLIICFPAFVYYRLLQRKLDQINESLKNNYPALIQYVLQLFENFIEINLYQRNEQFGQHVQDRNEKLYESQITQSLIQANSFRLFETTAALGLCTLIVYVILAKTPPDTTVLLLGLYTAAGFRAVPSLNRIFISLLQIRTNEHVLTQLSQFNAPKEVAASTSPVQFKSTLALNDISFAFAGKSELLIHTSLAIQKGQKIAITGPSGSGKTTVLLLLLRFLQETSGTILLDNVALREDQTSSWRNCLAYVPQTPVILDSSLLDNIRFGAPTQAGDERMANELLILLGLGSWMLQLPHGLNSRLGEKGIQLSGGQRQRIAIARALFRNAEVLLLDEVTSQVDTVTELEIHQALAQHGSADQTLIMVTHRQNSLHLFDRVIHLEHGKLNEWTVTKSGAGGVG